MPANENIPWNDAVEIIKKHGHSHDLNQPLPGDVVVIEVGAEILRPNPVPYTVKIPRAEWDAMQPDAREGYLIGLAGQEADETANAWAHVVDNPTPEQIADAI